MSFKKHLIRSIGRSTFFDWTVRLVDRIPNQCDNLLRVLTYHRIDEIESRPDLDPSLISATPEQFARQIGWMCRDFDLVSLNDVLSAVTEGTSLPPRALLLTFDDAYQDFELHAWPTLRDREAPAALFVPTGFPDEPQNSFWWDRLYFALVRSAYNGCIETPFGIHKLSKPKSRQLAFRMLKQRLKSLPEHDRLIVVKNICDQCGVTNPQPAVMGWDALKGLAEAGVSLVPHTHTHPLLDRVSPEIARMEIRQSREMLREKVGSDCPAFAYPSGHFNNNIANIVRDEGIKLAFTTIRGMNELRSCDLVKLRRCNVGQHTPDALIRMQLTTVSRYLNENIPCRPFDCKNRLCQESHATNSHC